MLVNGSDLLMDVGYTRKSEIDESPDSQLLLVGVELIGRSVGQVTGAELTG